MNIHGKSKWAPKPSYLPSSKERGDRCGWERPRGPFPPTSHWVRDSLPQWGHGSSDCIFGELTPPPSSCLLSLQTKNKGVYGWVSGLKSLLLDTSSREINVSLTSMKRVHQLGGPAPSSLSSCVLRADLGEAGTEPSPHPPAGVNHHS